MRVCRKIKVNSTFEEVNILTIWEVATWETLLESSFEEDVVRMKLPSY